MAERDGLTDQARKREEDYFRKRDRELIERMRAAAAAAGTYFEKSGDRKP